MIICPNCQHNEVTGTVFCSNCATQLILLDTSITHEIQLPETNLNATKSAPLHPNPQTQLNTWASLHMIENGQIISLGDQDEFTIGRTSEGQPIIPDVDITDFNAYANGVSRLHCVIKKANSKAYVMDLGSSNGTFHNGVRLAVHVETPINHGDVISLGKLKIQVLIDRAHL